MTPPVVGEEIVLMEQAGESGTILMGLWFHLMVMVAKIGPTAAESTEQEITWLLDLTDRLIPSHQLECIVVSYLVLEESLSPDTCNWK